VKIERRDLMGVTVEPAGVAKTFYRDREKVRVLRDLGPDLPAAFEVSRRGPVLRVFESVHLPVLVINYRAARRAGVVQAPNKDHR
jgi:hypothetical protein